MSKSIFIFIFMKTNLLSIGLTTIVVSLSGLIAGISIVVLVSCFYIVKWFIMKLFGLFF